MLAAVLNSPTTSDPASGAAGRSALLERYDYVLRGMVVDGQPRRRRRPTSYKRQAAAAAEDQGRRPVRRPEAASC